MKPRILLPGLVVLWSLSAEATSRMEMYDLASGKLVYLGAIREEVKGAQYLRRTHVCRADGELVFEGELQLDSPGRKHGTSRQRDVRHGIENSLVLKDDLVELSYRDSQDKPLETKTEKRPALCIAPDDLTHFVQKHWALVEKGETIYPSLAVPDAGRIVKFRLLTERRETTDRGEMLVLRFEPSSWLFRRFVDPVFLHFEVSAPYRLAEFRGPSAYLDDHRKAMPLRIVFTPQEDAALPCGPDSKRARPSGTPPRP